MRRTNALRRTLESMTETFNDRQKVDVEFDDGCYADIDGEYVAVAPNIKDWLGRNLSGPEELRVIVDSLSHEIEHIRQSDLSAKKDAMDYYEVQYRDDYDEDDLPLSQNHSYTTREAKVAGRVFNILEDQYIDWNRTQRFRGLRKSHAFFVQTQMDGRRRNNISKRPKAKALTGGLFQVAIAGYAKGIADADDDVQEFLAWARPHIEKCRYCHDPEQRLAIAKRVTDQLIEYLPDETTADDIRELFEDMPLEGEDDIDENSVRGGEYDVDGAEVDDDDLPDTPDADGAQGSAGEAGEPDDDSDADGSENDATPEVSDIGSGNDGDDDDDAPEGDMDDVDIDEDALYDQADDDANIKVDDDGAGKDDDDDDDGSGASTGIGHDAPGVSTESKEQFEEEKDERTGDAEDGEFDFDNVLGTMSDMDADSDSSEWVGLGDDADLGVSESDQRKYEQIREQVQKDQEPIEKAKKERDERAEDFKDSKGWEFVSSNDVREWLNTTGLANDVRRAFRKLATQDDEYASDEGHAIHVRNAVEHMAGNYGQDELYVDEHEAAHGGRLVGATVDMSGSMSAYEKEAKGAMGALHLATHEIGDDFCANTFFTYADNFNSKKPQTKLVTAPDESFEWSHLDSFTSESRDPLALGLQDLKELMDDQPAREKVMFAICDGKPTIRADGYASSAAAQREVKKTVSEIRSEGYVVIGLGIGNVSESNMQQMFGHAGDETAGYLMAESATLAEELVQTYKNQLGVDEVEY